MGSPTCPYCMQRADRCACEDPRIVGYENATPTPPAPADDAGGAEAMRADFLAWINAGYLVRDAVTPVEWDDEGLPLYYTRDDGVRHYLDGEWHAWQAARSLPLPATDDAVEEAAKENETLRRFLWRAVDILEDEGFTVFPDEVRTTLAALRGAKGGDK